MWFGLSRDSKYKKEAARRLPSWSCCSLWQPLWLCAVSEADRTKTIRTHYIRESHFGKLFLHLVVKKKKNVAAALTCESLASVATVTAPHLILAVWRIRSIC